MKYECIIIGGGIAGLQAAIQLGRYKHRVLVLDDNQGRSSICQSYHNILGYPNGVSGPYLREIGRAHGEQYGVHYQDERVVDIVYEEEEFIIYTRSNKQYRGMRLLLATGIMDHIPPYESLGPCLGLSVYVCPDCDGYEVKDKTTVVMGSGNTGANMALTLAYWTNSIIFVNDEKKEVYPQTYQQLEKLGIEVIEEKIAEVLAEGSSFRGVRLESGQVVEGERGFIAYGGNQVKSDLAAKLGVERLGNQHIITDGRSKMTNVPHVWAAGDVVAHSEQVTIAMGEGSQAAIWIHKSLINR
ncbi:NAD(P)/FAD-dependent oxidoreductase [Cytobacillus kochii]|uniref:NAD(P)/FAD-dependent oxidoreductase n=1 Tax=Cytobacillus kochii TaxID=859143 RepID=UPI00203BC14F|nr:NAD(P)/FAD-dependent oxidoreductase [Cytobacillus kochii]MCM3322364.1 NAD(P)/FAD-dependent oxidoreductase [Cytobacillus kochii]MCM3345159.1 NAD(P)/FAD-dependent oxidoreductase [Cytobacillus kochii]